MAAPFYKNPGFWLVVFLVGGPLVVILVGVLLLPKGTKRAGTLVSKGGGKWVIKYTVDGAEKTTPEFTTDELMLKDGASETMWITEDEKSPTAKRDSIGPPLMIAWASAILLLWVVVVIIVFIQRWRKKNAPVEFTDMKTK